MRKTYLLFTFFHESLRLWICIERIFHANSFDLYVCYLIRFLTNDGKLNLLSGPRYKISALSDLNNQSMNI